METDRLVGMLVGLAVGDTLGMPAEFQPRGSFPGVTVPRAGGPFDVQREEIVAIAQRLAGLTTFDLVATRFREDRFGGPGDSIRAIGHPDVDRDT